MVNEWRWLIYILFFPCLDLSNSTQSRTETQIPQRVQTSYQQALRHPHQIQPNPTRTMCKEVRYYHPQCTHKGWRRFEYCRYAIRTNDPRPGVSGQPKQNACASVEIIYREASPLCKPCMDAERKKREGEEAYNEYLRTGYPS
jgi:hypothetical protein